MSQSVENITGKLSGKDKDKVTGIINLLEYYPVVFSNYQDVNIELYRYREEHRDNLVLHHDDNHNGIFVRMTPHQLTKTQVVIRDGVLINGLYNVVITMMCNAYRPATGVFNGITHRNNISINMVPCHSHNLPKIEKIKEIIGKDHYTYYNGLN